MKKTLFIPLALVWLAIPAAGAHLMFGQSPIAHQIRPSGTHAQFVSTPLGSLGSEREQAVVAATRRYVESHPDAPLAMREGHELAPVAALNADLAAHDARFRVKAVQGRRAQFYDVS